MNDRHTHPDDPVERLVLGEPPAAFLKWSIALILGGSAAFLAVLFIVAPEQVRTARGGGPVVLALLAAAAWILQRRGKNTASTLVLGAGIWVYASGISLLLGGANSMLVIAYPVIITLAGWQLGPRVAVAVAVVSAATCFGFIQAELQGLLPLRPPTSPALLWIVQTAAFAFSALMISFIVRSYRKRLKQVRKLGSDLALHQAEILAREADLNRAQAVAHFGSWTYDIPADLIRLSAETCRIFGLPEGTTGSRDSYLSRAHPEDRAAVGAALQVAINGGKTFDEEHRILVGEETRWVRHRAEIEFSADGTPLRSVGTTQDVTERTKAQQELRKIVAFRELLLESMPLPVFYKDISERYVGGNSAFARFVGKPMEDIVGKTVFEISPGRFAQTNRDNDHDLLHGPVGLQTYETQVAHADGTLHDVILNKARTLDDAGMPTGILGVITDVTEIKRIEAARAHLEAQLRESQKMEALGTLAGGVAHDFNNILAAIMGNAELVRQDVGPRHAALESVEEILTAGRRAKELVQQILSFGRRQTLDRCVMSLAPVVVESVRLLRSTLPAGVGLSVECAPDAPTVLADATQVEQVLLNLCGNAWQAMQGQKRPAAIEIRLDAYDHAPGKARSAQGVALGGDLRPGRYARLTVRDRGPGMDRATLSRIFEPFFTTKPAGKGTGLGLAVVHSVVREHGASIEVESIPGEGTTFHIYFPAVEVSVPTAAAQVPDGAAAQVPDGAAAQGQPKHILYIDDDEAMVSLMSRLLERQGYRVSAYTDARVALAAVRARPEAFDLVVTDYNMPGMSGLEAARALRQISADLPVALTSGYITEELRAEAPAAGVSELIYKANIVGELCEAIARLANTQRGKEDSA